MFFGNVELHSTDRHLDFETNENNLDESDDDEQLAENNDNSNTSSEFSVSEVSDYKRNRKHRQILKKKRFMLCYYVFDMPNQNTYTILVHCRSIQVICV